jgi:hypothetical protein
MVVPVSTQFLHTIYGQTVLVLYSTVLYQYCSSLPNDKMTIDKLAWTVNSTEYSVRFNGVLTVGKITGPIIGNY